MSHVGGVFGGNTVGCNTPKIVGPWRFPLFFDFIFAVYIALLTSRGPRDVLAADCGCGSALRQCSTPKKVVFYK